MWDHLKSSNPCRRVQYIQIPKGVHTSLQVTASQEARYCVLHSHCKEHLHQTPTQKDSSTFRSSEKMKKHSSAFDTLHLFTRPPLARISQGSPSNQCSQAPLRLNFLIDSKWSHAQLHLALLELLTSSAQNPNATIQSKQQPHKIYQKRITQEPDKCLASHTLIHTLGSQNATPFPQGSNRLALRRKIHLYTRGAGLSDSSTPRIFLISTSLIWLHHLQQRRRE